MRLARGLLAAIVGLGGLFALGPAEGHEAVPTCEGDLTVDEVRGHEGQECTFHFKGLPIVAEGAFFTDHPNLRSNFHVGVIAVMSDGSRQALPIECVDYGRPNDPTAQCRVEWNPTGVGPLAADAPGLQDVVELICDSHSHATESKYLQRYFGAEAGGWFRCSSGVGAGGGGVELPAVDGVGAPAGPPAFAAVPVNRFATSPAEVSRSASQAAAPMFVNGDQALHDVVALDARHPDGSAPWCAEYEPGKCPLFWSALIGPGESTSVLGFDGVAPGSYQFYCSIHPEMIGTVEVTA